MNGSNGKVEGVIVPIITPVDEYENIDKKAFRAAIDHCIDAGVHGIFVGGSAGMGPLLKDDQWKVMAETAAECVQNRCILFGGVICPSTSIAIERIKFLEKCGYRYMVVTPTYYITLRNDEEFLMHFQTCSAATEMEMVVYNIPPCTYSQIPLTVLEKMAQMGLYRVVKESSADKAYFSQTIKMAGKYDLTILQGNEADIEWGLSTGAAGIVPVCANYEPQTFVAAYQAALNGDTQQLKQAQERIDFLRTNLLVKAENWIAGIMYGVSTLGIGNGKPVRPLLEVSMKTKRNIESLLGVETGKEVV